MKLSENIKNLLKNDKNKLILTVGIFVFGIFLMIFPLEKTKSDTGENVFFDIEQIRQKEENRLGKMLSSVKGVEEATVFISYKDSGNIDVVNEEKEISKKDSNDKEIQTERKPVYNSDKNTVIKKITLPVINGVCVFYKGDDSKNTRENLSKAVKGALGVELYKIEVVVLK